MRLALGLILISAQLATAQSWHSSLVAPDSAGRLTYVRDSEGNRIPDFSYAGYKNGLVPIPDVSVVKTISPLAGDNTAHIQAAIDEAAQRPLDGTGFRGAILMTAGAYRVSGRIQLNTSGVVLRGMGDDADTLTNTVILATGDSATQSIVLQVGGGSDTKWSGQVSGTKVNITSDTVLVGDMSFTVASTTPFQVGDNVVIVHPCTDAWLQAVNYGDTRTDAPWMVNQLPIIFNRYITGISGNVITVDAPIFNTLIRSRSQSYLYKYDRSGIRTNVGVEDIRVDIQAPGVTTDANGNERDHAWDAIWVRQVEDGWVRRSTALHFGQSGIKTSTSTRITIDSCRALDPVSIITGERRYNFNTYVASQLILFRDCYATRGRHDFVSNGTSSVSGIVFLRGRSEFTYASSEGHRQWSQGMLFDNVVFSNHATTGYVLGLYSRGDYGTGHGWAAVHSVAWNCSLGRNMVLQKPPTAQNYAIGCFASAIVSSSPFSNPKGYEEGTNTTGLTPSSLYEAQLAERLSPPTSVSGGPQSTVLPETCGLDPVFPNPFNPSVMIRYRLPNATHVSLNIYDATGRAITTLLAETRSAGTHEVQWNAQHAPSGVYWVVLRTNGSATARKAVLLK